MHVRVKDGTGIYVDCDMSTPDLVTWFEDHTDKDGNVTADLVSFFEVEMKADTEGIKFVMSDYSVDRDQERIDPAGWNLKAFKRNPVMLWSHDWSRPAIGKVEPVRKKEDQLIGSAVFDESGSDPFAERGQHAAADDDVIGAIAERDVDLDGIGMFQRGSHRTALATSAGDWAACPPQRWAWSASMHSSTILSCGTSREAMVRSALA